MSTYQCNLLACPVCLEVGWVDEGWVGMVASIISKTFLDYCIF